MFNLHLPITKYNIIWDPDVLLSYLETLDATKVVHLSIKTASHIMLFSERRSNRLDNSMLLSEHRVNALDNLKVKRVYILETECTFVFSSVLKMFKRHYSKIDHIILICCWNQQSPKLTRNQTFKNIAKMRLVNYIAIFCSENKLVSSLRFSFL